MEFLTVGEEGVVSVGFLWGRISEWEQIAISVRRYIANSIKRGVE